MLFTNPIKKIQITINHLNIPYSANFINKFSHMSIINDFIILTWYFRLLIHFEMFLKADDILLFFIKFQIIFVII